MCPICDHPLHKQHSRDHVAWHFMEELKAYIIDPSKCPECSYTGDKLESVARHLALFHQKLDQFLADTDLVAEKRAKAMAKPKKVCCNSLIFSVSRVNRRLLVTSDLFTSRNLGIIEQTTTFEPQRGEQTFPISGPNFLPPIDQTILPHSNECLRKLQIRNAHY